MAGRGRFADIDGLRPVVRGPVLIDIEGLMYFGPLRIAGTGHPQRDWFTELADYHLRQTLSFPAL
jgi:hypothetical protein